MQVDIIRLGLNSGSFIPRMFIEHLIYAPLFVLECLAESKTDMAPGLHDLQSRSPDRHESSNHKLPGVNANSLAAVEILEALGGRREATLGLIS